MHARVLQSVRKSYCLENGNDAGSKQRKAAKVQRGQKRTILADGLNCPNVLGFPNVVLKKVATRNTDDRPDLLVQKK